MNDTNQQTPLPTLQPGDSHAESLIDSAIQGHASTREAMRWLVRQIVPLQARAQVQGEPGTVAVDHFDNAPHTEFTNRIHPPVEIGTKLYATPQPAQATQAEVTDEQIDSFLRDLNSIACEYCVYEYGLPNHFLIEDNEEGTGEKMRAAVRAILALRPAAVPMTDEPIADAVAAEREACAQICDSMPYRVASARKASRAIRERGITAQAKKGVRDASSR